LFRQVIVPTHDGLASSITCRTQIKPFHPEHRHWLCPNGMQYSERFCSLDHAHVKIGAI
jgi:hypothetical protein